MAAVDELTQRREFLRGFLDMEQEARRMWRIDGPKGYHYNSFADFLLREARFWTAQQLPARYPSMIPRACYWNAWKLAKRFRSLRYVEGYAYGGLIPVMHAWCVDRDDRVIDPTWAGVYDDLTEVAYFGVVVPREYLREHGPGVIDDWQNHWPLMKRPWKEVLDEYDPDRADTRLP